ncbi:MAG TPA: erythromycin esterase family protein [Longimicrobium sp.]|nr:erythromycin esterase family protein [Longimicrobium sp.]
MRRPIQPIALLATLLACVPLHAQRPLNLDLERISPADSARPWGWVSGYSAFARPADGFAVDSTVSHDGRRSLRIAVPDSAPSTQAIMLQVPADFARGRELRLRGWMRTEHVDGRAILTLEAWKNRAFAAADTAAARSDPSAPPAWTRHELAIRVPTDEDIHSIVVAAAVEGTGTAWFDHLELAVDGTPIREIPPVAATPDPAGMRWLAAHASPLRTVDAPSAAPDDADLARFAEIVGGARIVALGESTHGTREFFQVKHRLLEYLVRVHGFRVFALEANQLAVERTNRYVQGGPGTAAEALRPLFGVWNTEEMLALVEWARGWNAAHPDRAVRFVGYDMQDHRTPADSLRAFLERAEPAYLPRLDTLTREYRAERSYATPHVADSTRARWSAQAETLWTEISGRRGAWLAGARTRADTVAAEWAAQNANLLRQAARFNVHLSSPERDSVVAANLDWALATLAPGARAVVWAHDVHVSKGGDPERSFNQGQQMGAFLRRTHGDGYRAFSLLTYDGAYTATRGLTDYRMAAIEAFPAPSGSLEHALHALPRPAGSVGWIVDLRGAREDNHGRWLWTPRPIRHIGYASYDYGFDLLAVFPLEFDGVVFIDHSTPSRLLR